MGRLGSLSLNASASYLNSNRQVTDGQPSIEQAGVVYLPPHWRGRVNAAWDVGNVSLSVTGTFVGRNKDNRRTPIRSEEHTSELQSLMRISYAVFCLKKKTQTTHKLQQLKTNNYSKNH